MKKVLIVCYSRTGTTLQVARQLAVQLGADVEQIGDVQDRSGIAGYLHSAVEAFARGLPSIRTRIDPSSYDLVVLGTPVWSGTMSAPMRSYLFRNRGALKQIAAFAVMGGVGAEAALQEIRALCGDENAPTCAFVERDVQSAGHRQRLEEFATGLKRLGRANADTIAAA
jgi:flavodoxin